MAGLNKIQGLPFVNYQKIYPYTRTESCNAWYADIRSRQQLLDAFHAALEDDIPVLTHGSAYSYGDMLLNDEGLIINAKALDKILSWDEQTGIIRCEAGIPLIQIFRKALPHNYTLPACPGGEDVTIAGAIANNVHGKDPFRHGNIGNFVRSITVLLASGEIKTYYREDEVFKMTIGGFGMSGIILEVELQLLSVPSPFVESFISAKSNLHDLLQAFIDHADKADFMVGWMDWLANGSQSGRGLISIGKWMDSSNAPKAFESERDSSHSLMSYLPVEQAWKWFNPFKSNTGTSLFNSLNYKVHRTLERIKPKDRKRETFIDYNFWTGKMPHTREFCGKHGYLEIQVMIPIPKAERTFLSLIETVRKFRYYPIMSVLKMHRADNFPLSFAGDCLSTTIELNLKNKPKELVQRFADEILDKVAKAGGRTYLAKDQVLGTEQFRMMYPEWKWWLEQKQQIDPEGRFVSGMYARLFPEMMNR